jgi:TonB-dependent SusC/RagA subfamily outer membrane receptor
MTSSSSQGLPVALLFVGCIAACAGNKTPASSQPVGASVTSQDISRAPAEPIEEQLMSRFPGVTVSRTSNGIAIRIRGATSLRGSNEPLYVVDGIRMQPGPDGGLAGLDPHDIAMIQVLKDAVSMVTYGGDAANGVIVIKTKRPNQ